MSNNAHPLVLFNTKFTEIKNGENAGWLTCLNCGEPLKKQENIIKCEDYHWKCEKCNIVIDKDIGQLYRCCRCDRVIEKTEDLVFEFITPNYKEFSFCHKSTGIGQYLCPKCHSRAIHKKRFRRIRNIPFKIAYSFYWVYRKIRDRND